MKAFVISFVGLLVATGLAYSDEYQQWHKVTLTLDGPETSETATPNPFTDYRLDVIFTHGDQRYVVPGYFAADGSAAQSSANSGSKWLVHFSPPYTGKWTWKASFRQGNQVAVADEGDAGEPGGFCDGAGGDFSVIASDKKAPDFRALGRLDYVGTRYPKTMAQNEIFLKVGVDAPENFLSYRDFDGDFKSDGIKDQLVKAWEPHVRDWKAGDPSWGSGKGKGIIGAVNYLASKGLNAVSFLTMNIEGDDRNVFPYLTYTDRNRFDVSRLAQWEIVFEHASSKGLFLHFKTQETENEKLLDDGDTGPLRKLYYRELIARFAHHPALNWNMGEENGVWKNHPEKASQSRDQRLAMGRFFEKNDPYQHPIVIHNGQWFTDLYGPDSPYCGASLQTGQETFKNVHRSTLNILNASAKAGKQWMVACDEPGDASRALVPDDVDPTHDLARQNALWGNLLAGGWGVEWYFGYKLPNSDLTCEDYRSRDKMWDQCRHALAFFRKHRLPLEKMKNQNDLLKNSSGYCLAESGKTYLLLVKDPGKDATLDFENYSGEFLLHWYNPRSGGDLQSGTIKTISGTGPQKLGFPPAQKTQDWVLLVRAKE